LFYITQIFWKEHNFVIYYIAIDALIMIINFANIHRKKKL